MVLSSGARAGLLLVCVGVLAVVAFQAFGPTPSSQRLQERRPVAVPMRRQQVMLFQRSLTVLEPGEDEQPLPNSNVSQFNLNFAGDLDTLLDQSIISDIVDPRHPPTGYDRLDEQPIDLSAAVTLPPPIKVCPAVDEPTADEEHVNQPVFVGCFASVTLEDPIISKQVSLEACISACRAQDMSFVVFDAQRHCSCSRSFSDLGSESGSASEPSTCNAPGKSALFFVGGAWPPVQSTHNGRSASLGVVPVFLYTRDRLASLWLTCRFTRFSNTRYEIYDLKHKVSIEQLFHVVLKDSDHVNHPAIIVMDSCCVHGWALQKWPRNAIFHLAADESARWGFALKNGKNWWGPHGPHGPLPSNSNNTMILPTALGIWYKQYFSQQHRDTYPTFRYLPLGSRAEFPNPPTSLKPATSRKYLCSFMGAPTNYIRKYLREVLAADLLLPSDKTFLHLADHWSTDPNDPNSGYINSTEYAKIMLESVFTFCPKGNSVEQYRIYEAIESGSIPIFALEDGYTRERLPPEYFDSPMLFVQDWKDAPALIMELVGQPAALLRRQAELMAWYTNYMQSMIMDIEANMRKRLSS